MGEPTPLDFAPGIVKTDAPYALRGRYIDADKVRFVKGKPEKWKGWETLAEDIPGIARAAFSWDDDASNRRIAVGTHLGLFLSSTAGVLTKITPFRITGTLGNNPFATTNTLTTVVVTHAAHGVIVGTYVNFDGAVAGGGITIDGEYQVSVVVDINSYVIIHSSAATSTVNGGGAAVTYQYEINPGIPNVTQGLGWGTGTWGTGTWGTPRTSSDFTSYATQWSLDKYGENLLAQLSGNYLYQWDPDTPSDRAAKVTNSPTGNFMFMTNERYPVILGANGDNMTLAWPDQNDITNWTPSSTSTANERPLQKGSRLVAGSNLIGTSNIVWSDAAAYSMSYTGQRNRVYNTLLLGEKCGIVGPHAFAVANGTAFWRGPFTFHMSAGGSVQGIPNAEDIAEWLDRQLDTAQNWKAAGTFSAEHNEVRWHFVIDGELEPSFYVAVSLDDFSWTNGTLNRGTWAENAGINPNVYATDENGTLFIHETGYDADGVAMSWLLESAPIELDDGGISVNIWGYIPNFHRQIGDITVTFTTWDLPQDTVEQETESSVISTTTGIVDLHLSGRQASIKLEGAALGGDFRLGLGRAEISGGGKRRGGGAP